MSTLNDAASIWQQFHWSFFINTQGLILAVGRFKNSLERGDIPSARTELTTAAELLRSSGAAMQLAASFKRGEYEQEVRPSMLYPEVDVDNFSGLMSWDHAVLIQLWKQLRSTLKDLPTELQAEHQQFVAAYDELATSHHGVCKKFGGGESGSIRYQSEVATDVLDRFRRNRIGLLDPNQTSGCPFHRK